jgi:hypothetical protein
MKTTTKTRTKKAPFFTLGLLLLLLSTSLTFAQNVIRVQNGQNIQNVIDNATTAAGSVLLLDPGSYEGFEVRKRVSIIGSGSFGTNASSITGRVSFTRNNNSNSDNSLITGCSIESIQVEQNNIIIQRCRINTVFTGVNIENVNNCKVFQCFIVGSIGIFSTKAPSPSSVCEARRGAISRGSSKKAVGALMESPSTR